MTDAEAPPATIVTTAELKSSGDTPADIATTAATVAEPADKIISLNPKLKLPPVVSRLGSLLEYDPLGNPYYKFPPFLAPPDGTTLIPFVSFKPSGIVISFDPDEAEVDGEGIETVQLSAKHVAPGDKEKKRKRRKGGKSGPGGPDDIKTIPKWWEDWMEGEDLRRADVFDPNIPRTERFAQGAADFQRNRRWTPPLQSIYDHFRLFVGLRSNKNTHFNKKFRNNKGGAAYGAGAIEDADDEDDDEDEFMRAAEQEKLQQETAASLAVAPAAKSTDFVDDGGYEVMRNMYEEIDAEAEAREQRMDVFLDDPEHVLKIFFSSFYKDKGLCWSVPKLRDGPILMHFFLQFFLRNRLMRDYERAFNKALLLVDLARVELPLTSKICLQVPDQFSRACVECWGAKMPTIWNKDRLEWDMPKPAAKDAAFEEEMERQGAERIDVSTLPCPPPLAPEPDIPSWGSPTNHDTWTTPVEATTSEPKVSDKSDNNDESSPDRPSISSLKWDAIPDSVPDPWTSNVQQTEWDPTPPPPPPSLMPILGGPVVLPLTHQVTLVEQSVRRIVSFSLPADDGPERGGGGGGNPIKTFEKTLASVVLAPWIDEAPEGVSTIIKPSIVMGDVQSATKAKKAHDMTKDLITVYFDPETAETLKTGMGMHAIWVRVGEVKQGDNGEEGEEGGKEEGGREESATASNVGMKKEGGSGAGGGSGAAKKRKGKGKNKGKSGGGGGGAATSGETSEEKEFWYLEFLYDVIPSFWTDATGILIASTRYA